MRSCRVLVALLASACLPEKSDGMVCGEGTHEEDGACVGDEGEDDTAEPSDEDTAAEDSGGDSGGGDSGGGSGGDSGGGDSGGGDSGGGDSGGGSGGDSGGGDSGGGDSGGSSSGGGDDTGSGSSGGSSSGGSSSGGSSGGGSSGGSYTVTVCGDGSGDYTDIQDAVDDASDGDVIGVCAGTWGPVQIEDVSVTLEGMDGADVTTIEGDSSDPAIFVDDEEVEISGFTLRGTSTSSTAAVYILNATVSVHDSHITNNYAGTPVWASASETEWDGVLFEDNAPTGFVFMASGTGSLVLRHSIFRNNEPTGHMLYIYSTSGEVSNNLFYDNDLDNTAAYVSGHAAQDLYNNVFYGNTSSNNYLLQLDDEAKVQNSILAGNTSKRETLYLYKSTAAYSALYDNTSTESGYSGGTSCSGCTTTSMSTSDCQLTDPAGEDFTLDTYSPCEDAGNPSSLYDDVDGSANDLGAYGGPSGTWP